MEVLRKSKQFLKTPQLVQLFLYSFHFIVTDDAPEVIAQACAKCTTAQKHIVRVLTQSFKNKWPQDYEVFKKKYDPEGIYFEKLEAAVADF